jgi:hypothetical protein
MEVCGPALCGRQGVPQSRGDRLIAVAGRMLVDQRGARARMTEARHQLLEAGASGGGERAAFVAEVMKVETG